MTNSPSSQQLLTIRQVSGLPGTALSTRYASHRGQPIIDRVDPTIFTRRYFTHCMQCDFCHDSCCQHGADIDLPNIERLLAHESGIAARIGAPASEWLRPEPIGDSDFPGGEIRRTAVRDGACIFLNRKSRGCSIHTYCLENGLDYHDIKPSVCWLFPLTVDGGLLHPNLEIVDKSLICLGPGPTLYQSQRSELLHLFPAALVTELDAMEKSVLASAS